MTHRIAIMQPYFMPYTGYFKLFPRVDTFVVFDCVQFTRRGFIHRNRLYTPQQQIRWLTLPLKKAAQSVKIHQLEFNDNAALLWSQRLDCFFPVPPREPLNDLMQRVRQLKAAPVDYLLATLKACCEHLDLPCHIIRSSSLALEPELRGQARILAICQHLGASHYLNLPGGRSLYQATAFAKHRVSLEFLPEYTGDNISILYRLWHHSLEAIKADL